MDTIEWASTEITARNSSFTYYHIDVKNDRYNRTGTKKITDWSNVLDDKFDLIYCYSVFSHLEVSDARELLSLLRDFILPEGKLFLTAFVGQQEDDVIVNPEDMSFKCDGPLHVVRYRHDYLLEMFQEAKFRVVFEINNLATDNQVIYILT